MVLLEAPHGITFFFDYDHSSSATKDYVKDFMDFWVEEYHIDGWRWDFTQGMTQTNTIGVWAGQYDQFRIDLLNEYGSKGWKMVSQMKHDSEADFEIARMTTFMREAQ